MAVKAVIDLLGARLEKLREKAGLTQDEVAQRVGVARSTYANYESEKREPDLNTLRKLADLFDVTVGYLVGDKPSADVSSEEAEFLKWVDENLESSFFYDFDRSPEQSKAQLMEDLRYLWEREKKQRDRGKGKREE